MSQAEDCSPGDSLSDSSEELLPRSPVSSTALYLVRTKDIKHDRGTFLQRFKNDRLARTQQVSMTLVPGKGALSSKEY